MTPEPEPTDPPLAWDRLWKRTDVARYLGMHPRTTYQHPTLEALAVRISQRTIRFEPAAVKQWVEDHDWNRRKWRRRPRDGDR